MLNTLRGNGFDCLLTLISIKMEHPRPLQGCTNVCIIFAHTGAGVIRVLKQWENVTRGVFEFKTFGEVLRLTTHFILKPKLKWNDAKICNLSVFSQCLWRPHTSKIKIKVNNNLY